MLLEVRDLHSYYGKSHILQGVDLHLDRGETVCLLGRNGVGKTTTLKSIMGMVRPAKGRVLLDGSELTGLLPYQIARMGVGIVPEDRRILPSLTVHENLLIGMKLPAGGKQADEETWEPDRAYRAFPSLQQRRQHMGGHLSGGEQQMLSVARTLMGNPLPNLGGRTYRRSGALVGEGCHENAGRYPTVRGNDSFGGTEPQGGH